MPETRFLAAPRRRDRRPTHETAHRVKVSNARGPWIHSTMKAVAAIDDIAKRLVCVDICRRYGVREIVRVKHAAKVRTMPAGSWKPNAVTEYAVRHFRSTGVILSEIELRSLADNGSLGLWTADQYARAAKREPDGLVHISDGEMESVRPQTSRERRKVERAKERAGAKYREIGETFRKSIHEAHAIALANGAKLEAIKAEIDSALKGAGL